MPSLNPNKPEHLRKRQTEASKRYRAKHPEKVKATHLKVYYDRRKRALDLLGGAICVECGCDELKYLEINHIGGGGCKELRKNGRGLWDAILKGDRSTEGLNVLCRVCNAIEFLGRKLSKPSGKFHVRWQKFTGQRAVKIENQDKIEP